MHNHKYRYKFKMHQYIHVCIAKLWLSLFFAMWKMIADTCEANRIESLRARKTQRANISRIIAALLPRRFPSNVPSSQNSRTARGVSHLFLKSSRPYRKRHLARRTLNSEDLSFKNYDEEFYPLTVPREMVWKRIVARKIEVIVRSRIA